MDQKAIFVNCLKLMGYDVDVQEQVIVTKMKFVSGAYIAQMTSVEEVMLSNDVRYLAFIVAGRMNGLAKQL